MGHAVMIIPKDDQSNKEFIVFVPFIEDFGRVLLGSPAFTRENY